MFFERLKAGLRRTRELLLGRLNGTPEDLETALLSADVGISATQYLLDRLNRQKGERRTLLKQELIALLQGTTTSLLPTELPARPYIIMVVGVNGSGKTTTVGKLAYRYRQQGRTLLVAASDTYRDAAAPQLRIWTERAGVEIVYSERGQDAAAVAFDAISRARAKGLDMVLVDTAGRLHTRKDLMEEVKKIRRVITKTRSGAPDEILLVLDATVGQNGIIQARQFHTELGLTGLVVTKLDGTARAGVLIPIVRELGLPIRYIGVGEGLEDLDEFSAPEFVEALLGGETDE